LQPVAVTRGSKMNKNIIGGGFDQAEADYSDEVPF
jgi:hypothetical protein